MEMWKLALKPLRECLCFVFANGGGAEWMPPDVRPTQRIEVNQD
jgi:hypothetical protein